MSKKLVILCTVLILGIVGAGCARHRFLSSAQVKLPASTSDQTQVISYAQSSAFAEEVRTRATKMGVARFEIRIHRRDTSLLELGALSVDAKAAAQAANLMATILAEFAAAHDLGAVELMNPALVPDRYSRE